MLYTTIARTLYPHRCHICGQVEWLPFGKKMTVCEPCRDDIVARSCMMQTKTSNTEHHDERRPPLCG